MLANFKYDIFIAYASEDADYARKLHLILEAAGFQVFSDLGLTPGASWEREIRQAQQGSLLTVVLISDYYSSAKFLQKEIRRAVKLSRNKRHRIVPVYLPGKRTEVDEPEELGKLHSIFFDDASSLLAIAQKIEATVLASKGRVKWQHEIDPATIIIVTGCHHVPEIYDRPMAYELEKAIDDLRKSIGKGFLRSVVVGDIWLRHYSHYPNHPNVISLGSDGVNSLTGLIAAQGSPVEASPDGRWHIVRSANRWAVFGTLAEDTHDAVSAFKNHHLARFVQDIWSSP